MLPIIELKIIPSSGRQEITRESSGLIKCYLKSPPEKGKANQELVKFLAQKLRVPQHTMKIVSGATTRTKKILVSAALSLDEMYQRLGLS